MRHLAQFLAVIMASWSLVAALPWVPAWADTAGTTRPKVSGFAGQSQQPGQSKSRHPDAVATDAMPDNDDSLRGTAETKRRPKQTQHSQAGEATTVVGPLVGQVTATSASLWIHADRGAQMAVEYGLAEGNTTLRADFVPIDDFVADKIPGQPAKATLNALRPDAAYTYRIAVNGVPAATWAGRFKTAPQAGQPAAFRLGLTSCMKYGEPQGSWTRFLNDKPDLHLTVGDTQYSDSTNPNRQWEHHLRYRKVPEYAAVNRNLPTFAMWDDHDYGPNDSDASAKGKEKSLISWRQIWCNPPSGSDPTPGAFFRFSWGDVDFFVVDGRYHRSPDKAPDDEHKRMLGDPQFAWLLDGLRKSQAKFKVIASGSTLHHSGGDGWRIYTFSRHRLFDAINEHRIAGVMYMSGDIHRSLVWEHPESDRVGYPLVEVISSGIANSKTLSYATIDFDTTIDDPTVRVRIVLGNGTVQENRTWKLSQLTPQ